MEQSQSKTLCNQLINFKEMLNQNMRLYLTLDDFVSSEVHIQSQHYLAVLNVGP